MEDQIIENGGSVSSACRQEYSDRLFFALVASCTDDIRHGLENFMRKNHVGRLDLFKAFLADCGHSIVEAHQLAIIERRRQRKLRTKARNEKIKADRIAAREEYRRKKAEQENNEGWGAVSLPERMFVQFFPKKGDASPTYKGISVKFPDGTNLTLQECSADGLESLISIYKKRKEAAVCSD